MKTSLKDAQYLLSETDPNRLGGAQNEVAFVGRSNVGKSSLLNAICERTKRRSLAIVSKTPGRTRAINVFVVGHQRWLVDLPGYGYASGPASSREGWPAMIEGYLTGRPSLRGIYLLIDGKVGPTKLDHQMREWLKAQSLPYILVATKMDQVKPSQRHEQQKRIAQGLETTVPEMHWVSATEGTGMGPLRQNVLKLLN